jgi:RNA polymerase sigma-70 factor (ECF subfamily)
VLALDEKELISLSQKGDIDAFEELVARYERKVYTIAYRYMGNPEDASDLAQETFLKVFKSIDKFRGESSFSTWIYRITANICKDELRKIKRKPQTSLDQEIWLDEGSVIRQVVDEKPTPDEAFEQKELWNYLQDLIANLSPEYRMVIVLRDINGYSYEEIAQITETSLGTVKSRLNRARKALSEQINLLKGGIK